jgi:hypothetical protein
VGRIGWAICLEIFALSPTAAPAGAPNPFRLRPRMGCNMKGFTTLRVFALGTANDLLAHM